MSCHNRHNPFARLTAIVMSLVMTFVLGIGSLAHAGHDHHRHGSHQSDRIALHAASEVADIHRLIEADAVVRDAHVSPTFDHDTDHSGGGHVGCADIFCHGALVLTASAANIFTGQPATPALQHIIWIIAHHPGSLDRPPRI